MIFTPDPRFLDAYKSTYALEDEFASGGTSSGTVGSLGWQTAGTIASKVAETALPGIYNISTGAVSGTPARVSLSQIFIPTFPHEVLWRIRQNTKDANTTSRYGAAASVAGTPPNDGIYFENLDAEANWFCVTRASSNNTGSRIDSGVAVSTNPVKLYYEYDGTRVRFYIDDVLVSTNTTNIPTVAIGLFAYIINSTAASKSFDPEFMKFRLTGLAR